MKLILALGAAMALATSAFSQVTPTGPFTGTLQEDFEGPQVIFTPCMPAGVFGGGVQMCTPNHSGCHTTSGWGFFCSIYPFSGQKFFGSADGAVEFDFGSSPVTRFGGQFFTNSNVAGATVDFYDAANNLIGTVLAGVPTCPTPPNTWGWDGWTINPAAKRIMITGSNPYNQGAFVDMDALEADTTTPPPPPSYYCTSGTATTGCSAQINASAQPSASLSTPCVLTLSNVSPNQFGIVFYGVDNTGFLPLQWALGSTSYLCIKSPIQRSPPANSGGTTGQCDGQIVLDWNLLQTTFPGLLGTPFSAGDDVFAQGWYRDPGAPKNTQLSNAVELTMLP